MFLRLIENLIFTLNFENIIFTIFLLLNFYFLYSFVKKKIQINDLFLFSIIGLLGFLQSL